MRLKQSCKYSRTFTHLSVELYLTQIKESLDDEGSVEGVLGKQLGQEVGVVVLPSRSIRHSHRQLFRQVTFTF